MAVFGEEVRGAPKPRGLGLVLWGLPAAALAGAALVLSWWLRSGAGSVAPLGSAPVASALTPDESARLEAERRQLPP